MRKIIIAALLLFSNLALAQVYVLDPHHTNARFEIAHFDASTNHGGFYMLDGELKYNPQQKTASITIAIPTMSIQTGNKIFDKHMFGKEILNAAKYPNIVFKSKKWHFANGKPQQIEGELEMLGKTNPVVLQVKRFNCYHHPMFKRDVCGGDFSAEIDRSLWGINYLLKPMGKTVSLSIQAEASPKESAAKTD